MNYPLLQLREDTMLTKLNSAFAAGVLGGLANSIIVWFFGAAGIAGALGVMISPALSPKWLYPRLVWGGLWGFLFLIPVMKRSVALRGLICSIAPSFVMLFIIFPKMGKGFYGLSLGTLTPVMVLFYNAIWGIVAALWYKISQE